MATLNENIRDQIKDAIYRKRLEITKSVEHYENLMNKAVARRDTLDELIEEINDIDIGAL